MPTWSRYLEYEGSTKKCALCPREFEFSKGSGCNYYGEITGRIKEDDGNM
jgi:hypothetical protein